MPRLSIEHTANMIGVVALEEHLDELVQAIAKVPTIDSSLIKARLWCPQVAYIGPKDQRSGDKKGYLFVKFEWLEGREKAIEEQLKRALKAPLERVKTSLPTSIACSITLEIAEIRRDLHEAL